MRARLNEILLSKAHILKKSLRAGMKFHYRKLTFWKAGSPEWNFNIESSHFEKPARLNEISLSKAHILKSRLARLKFHYRKLTFWKAGSRGAPEWKFNYRKLTFYLASTLSTSHLRWICIFDWENFSQSYIRICYFVTKRNIEYTRSIRL